MNDSTRLSEVRLNKFIAGSGYCARRKADLLISAGAVKVNGKTITKMGTKINPAADLIEIAGQKIRPLSQKIYIALNKPRGIICSCKDTHNRKVITSLVPFQEKLYPVGRLDADSEGLIILTNDGALAYKLTHPAQKKEKEYIINITGRLTPQTKKQIEKGLKLDEFTTSPCRIQILKTFPRETALSIIICEGKKRQIRLTFQHFKHHVLKLIRIRIGGLKLQNLPSGEYRLLTEKDLKKL